MIKLRRALTPYLKAFHPRVYFQDAPDSADFPYLVFDFPNVTDDGENHQGAVIDIDGWDMPADGDTTTIEELMETINDSLNKATLSTAEIRATFYLDRKLSLAYDDKRIKRRKYVYQASFYELP